VGEGGDEVSVARFIADQRTFDRVPQALTCAILGASVSWFYKWLHREPTDRQRRRAELDTRVAELFVASKRTYGSPRIHADLLDEGWKISVNTVADSMRRQGLQGRKPKRPKGLTRQDKRAPKFSDLLRGNFSAPAPNLKCCGDLKCRRRHFRSQIQIRFGCHTSQSGHGRFSLRDRGCGSGRDRPWSISTRRNVTAKPTSGFS
jgi:transposase InsO family protein